MRPSLPPPTGKPTVTWFASVTPATTFKLEVVGAAAGLPGRTERKPLRVGLTAVTLRTTPVAPVGTTVAEPDGAVGTLPVTFRTFATPEGTGFVMPTSMRVSAMRLGAMSTNVDRSPELIVARATGIERAPATSPTVAATTSDTASVRLRARDVRQVRLELTSVAMTASLEIDGAVRGRRLRGVHGPTEVKRRAAETREAPGQR